VLGAAMLGRFAAEVSGGGEPASMSHGNWLTDTGAYANQKAAEEASERTKEDLWKIMVRGVAAGDAC
jgi:hypothetical protein